MLIVLYVSILIIIQKTQLTLTREELQSIIESLTSQLDESNDKLSYSLSLNQQLENQLQGTEANNAFLTSQLNEFKDKLSLSSSQLNEFKDKLSLSSSQLNEFKDKLSLSSSQLNEARNKLSEVEKNYQLLSGDYDALSNISLEQCDELILTSNHNQEKLLQRRVSNETYL